MDERFEQVDLGSCEQLSIKGSSEPVASFVQGTSGDANKSSVVLVSPSPRSFGDICSDTVGCSHHLLSNCVSLELIPFPHQFPNNIREIFSELIDTQIFEAS